jgi:site-specific DNA-methyltransferase (adenine-specific)
LWDRDYEGKCEYHFHQTHNNVITRYDYLDSKCAGVVIRDPQSHSILEKIELKCGEYYKDADNNFSGLVSPKDFFTRKPLLSSNWTGYKDQKDDEYCIKYYLINNNKDRIHGWISLDQLVKNKNTKDLNKVYIPGAGGKGCDDGLILGTPFYGEPNSVCSQTFMVIGYDVEKHNLSKEECQNIIKYIYTKFFRYLVSIKKKTQNGPRGVYQFVPLQNFTSDSDIDWSKSTAEIDQQLYAKYDLTADEIDFIESKIKYMKQ